MNDLDKIAAEAAMQIWNLHQDAARDQCVSTLTMEPIIKSACEKAYKQGYGHGASKLLLDSEYEAARATWHEAHFGDASATQGQEEQMAEQLKAWYLEATLDSEYEAARATWHEAHFGDASATQGQEEQMAEQLHVWYLEATQALDPANYNPKAQKSYAELNEQQKEIDRYIARKVNAAIAAAYKRGSDFARKCCAEEEKRDLIRLEQQLDALRRNTSVQFTPSMTTGSEH